MNHELEGTWKRSCRAWAATALLLGATTLFTDSASAAECLSKSVIRPDGTTGQHTVLAPRREVQKYTALGYRVEQCSGGLEQFRRASAVWCAAAESGPLGLRQSAQPGAVSIVELCASARAAVAELEREAAVRAP